MSFWTGCEKPSERARGSSVRENPAAEKSCHESVSRFSAWCYQRGREEVDASVSEG